MDVMNTFDAIVIGTGQAGPPLARELAGQGMRVAIIERHRFGGTCVNTGCIPTKAMIASARAVHQARRGAEFGFSISGTVRANLMAIVARKNAIVSRSSRGVEKSLRKAEGCTVIQGQARFRGPHAILVGEREVTAEKIFINVGGRARVPDMPGLESVPYFDNSSLLDLDLLPEHLIVVGGSYVGLEFAQMFRRFGSRVTVVEKSERILSREDPDVSEAIQKILQAEDIDVRTGAECIRLEDHDRGVRVDMECEGPERLVDGTHVLLAVGRQPNTDDLGLDRAGIAVNEDGFIEVNDRLETNVSGVWALGDCNGRGAFTHTSYNDYEIVSENVLRGGNRRVTDRILAYAVYVDPPLGRAGMTEADVRQLGRKVCVGTVYMEDVTRAWISGDPAGFMKIFVDAETNTILGASVLGYHGDEVIHSILDVMYAQAPYSVIERAVHIHPTVSEYVPVALADLKPLE
jgi:pyruvate/2-oxoglutarate dehydrogenase complex dihydrolipoamide dehydrogenase (E3) component